MLKKIVIIGAGSAMFTQGLVIDLLKNPCGFQWHLCLVDIDGQTLEAISKLVEKMLLAKGADILLTSTTDRCEVLPGADYVITTIGVGGRRAWEQDVFIPRKYGVNQPVGDTAMPGGISRAMRMIPAMLDIANDIQQLCPDAYFFNYANPMTANCRAIRKKTASPVVGLCHGVHHCEAYLAQFAGLEKHALTARAVGVNHLTFLYDIRNNGRDIRPLLRQKLAEIKAAATGRTHATVYKPQEQVPAELDEPFSWEIFDRFAAFPAPGDRHITEFLVEHFPGGSYYGKTLGYDAYSFEKTIKYGDRIHAEMIRLGQSTQPLPDDFFSMVSGEHEQLMDIIDAIEHDRHSFFSVNLPNEGAVKQFPASAVLEMPAIAMAGGLKPLQLDDFPDDLAALIQRPLAIVEMTVEAALTGNRHLMEEAILMGGYLSDAAAVARMTDELLKAQKSYLPQF
ncbi:MAG: hypothetical protein GX173_11340 [Ruminococcaceae bacterium]|nr:hypothetical protein [Oscillospiraceae bacterium]